MAALLFPHTASPATMSPPSMLSPATFRRCRRRPPNFSPAAFILLLPVLIIVAADPDDQACLSNLRASLEDPENSLHNWTKSTFRYPCNGFTSYLDGATCNNGRIYKLLLPGRSLRGSISPFLSNCTNLQTLDMSSNSLTGAIPPDLSSLLNLAILNLSANLLSGQIPPQIALCAYLNVIDLHSNYLSGHIPDQLSLLARLSALDVSYNRLEGPIPVLLANRTGAASRMPRFNASSFVGNKDLFGFPLPPMRGRGLSVLAIVGIGFGSGMLSLVLSFTAVCIWLRATERPPAGGMLNGEDGKISHHVPDY
ncbi:hypothetical protein KSP40_PGU020186 [Platanthera guangdongensis]|uniref:Uncharacterized protein n=1 Tax=Platanthera guangdongensis TaxID=2320717 RepID=A0ABR2MG25_9ASPA